MSKDAQDEAHGSEPGTSGQGSLSSRQPTLRSRGPRASHAARAEKHTRAASQGLAGGACSLRGPISHSRVSSPRPHSAQGASMTLSH